MLKKYYFNNKFLFFVCTSAWKKNLITNTTVDIWFVDFFILIVKIKDARGWWNNNYRTESSLGGETEEEWKWEEQKNEEAKSGGGREQSIGVINKKKFQKLSV